MVEEDKKMKILMHMPHVSLDVPKEFYEGLLIPKNLFHKHNDDYKNKVLDSYHKNLDDITKNY